MAMIILTVPGGSDADVTDGGIGFEFAASYNTARLPNGDWAVIAPAGVKVDTTPAKATVGGRATNGAKLNHVQNGTMPFDAGMSNYTAGAEHDPDTIMRPGDVLLKMVGEATIDPDPADNRDGLTNQWSALHVVTAAPAVRSLSPAVWTGPNRPWDQFDIDGVLGDLPSYSATASDQSWATLKTTFGRRDFGLAISDSTTAGYQELTPRDMGEGPSNYGGYLGVRYDRALIGMLSDTWSDNDKAECFWWAASLGYDNLMARFSAGQTWGGIGAHFQADVAFKLLAIKATGRLSQYEDFMPYIGGPVEQCYIHDATSIAALAPHDDPAKSYLSRRRDVLAVNSTTQIEVEMFAGAGDSNSNNGYVGALAVRDSDGATSLIASQVQNGTTSFTWNLATPMTGNTTSDRFSARANFTVTEGMGDWRLLNAPNWNNPIALVEYRALNAWTMRHRFARALGMVGGGLDPWDAWTLRANSGADGMPDLIEPESAAFVAAHSTAILALPQIV
jgi:hypothetical protein